MKKELIIGAASAYHSYPDNGRKHPGLILIEEIWGLNDHIKDVADRFAKEGYSVLAPELLPRELLGQLTPEFRSALFDPAKRDEVQPKMRAAMQPIMQPEYAKDTIAILKKCVDYLLVDGHVEGKVGVLGFCFGGSYSFHLAANDRRIRAAVAFYGQAPSADEIPYIDCPVLAFYGDQDINLMQSLPQLKASMKEHGRNFEAVVYPNAGHAFFNDTNTRMYNPSAAKDAWEKTLAFLKKHLTT